MAGAYQPIEMPQFHGFGFADAVAQARDRQRQDRMDAWNQMIQGQQSTRAQGELELRQRQQADEEARRRQQEQDRQVAETETLHTHLQDLTEAGMPHEAQTIAQIHGYKGAQQQVPSPSFVGPLETPEGAQARARQEASAQATQGDQTALMQQVDQAGQGAADEVTQQQAARDQFAQAQTNAPTTYTGPGGQSFSVDPRERIMAARAHNKETADRFKAAFQAEPTMAPYAGEFAARAELGEPAANIFADLKARQVADAAAKAKAAGEPAHSAGRFEQEKELTKIRAAAEASRAAVTNVFKADTANRQDMGTLRQGFKEWKNTVQLPIDAKMAKRLQTITANINSGNSMQQREAAESLVSVFRGGGMVTKASQDLLLKHLGGLVGDAQTWLQHLESGHYGERELNVLKQAANAALQEQNDKAQEYYQSAADTFGPGSGYENLGPNVNHMVRGAFRQFGLEVPEVYGGAGEGAGVALGSGKRPSGHKAPKAAAAGGGQLTGEDATAVAWAKANKGDPRAAKILQLHGM